MWSRCSHGIVSKKQSRPLKLCKDTEKGFDIVVTFFFFWISPSNVQNKTSMLRQIRWKFSKIEWHSKVHVHTFLLLWSYGYQSLLVTKCYCPTTKVIILISYNYKLSYTYIMPYSLGRKYTYKIEKHPRIIFFWIYVPREAFSQSFRALSGKGKSCAYSRIFSLK